MAKSKSKGPAYISKGIVGVNKKVSNAVRREKSEIENYTNQMNAFRKGKNVVLTVQNPNPNETNKKLIKVNAKDILGNWRDL